MCKRDKVVKCDREPDVVRALEIKEDAIGRTLARTGEVRNVHRI
jgi:muconolactone delta-isomerase